MTTLTEPIATEQAAAETPAHSCPAEDILRRLGSDKESGLTTTQARENLRRFGPNALAEPPPTPAWRQFLGQFEEPVVWLLLGAGAIAAALHEWADLIAISAIVVLNALLGFFQQRKAEKALSALRRLSAPTAKVVRDGAPSVLPAHELTPGDLVVLEAGDQVPADVRLVGGFGLRVTEASLTGESTPAGKDALAILSPTAPLGDRCNMAYLGTVVATGKASGVVVATGMSTELGRIAGLLRAQPTEPTPLQKRLARLGGNIVLLCIALVALIALLQLARGESWLDTLRLAVGLAVAAVPEGLPAVVTITLALGVQRMVQRNALIRRLSSVETLGSVTVICSDKTGTLTRNEMTARELYVAGERFKITGLGYRPDGDFLRLGASQDTARETVDPRRESDLLAALTVGARCNHAMVVRTADENGWTAIGDPTEAALVVAAKKAGIPAGPHGLEVVAELPFDSDRKAMSLVTRDERGRCTVFTKGAPEVVLAGCSRVRWQGQEIELNAALRAEIAEAAAEMASRALRVIALAYRDEVAPHADGDYENDLVFAGLAGLIDPPRDEARTAVARCRAAGIRPIMITGDHPATALAIAKELGIAGEHDRNVTGRDLEEMSDEALSATVDSVAVYARVTAEHKLRIVKSLHARGQIVAMTGDGVNDAPAVKAADIGVAMGVAGTDVTKEASAMVLTDDNFASIVNAVEEGRGIYDNIKKFVAYLLAGNAGKLLVMFLAVVFGWPVPLLAVQILWLNLVTDGLAALALGVEPPEPGVMKRKPRRPSDPILSASDAYRIVAHGALAAGAALLGFWLVWQGDSAKLAEGQVVAFCILGFSQLLYALACRSETATVWALGFTTNRALLLAIAGSAALQSAVVVLPFLHSTFGVEAYPTPFEWLLIVLLSLVPALVVESLKLTRGRSADEGIAPSRDGLSLG